MSKLSDQRSKSLEMSSNAQVPDLMFRAFPPNRQGNRKSWLASVARSLGWKHRRVKALFYCEARVVTADEWRTLNQRLDALKAAERRHGEQVDELRALGRMARVEATMAGGIAGGVGDGSTPEGIAEPRQDDPASGRSVFLAR